MKLNSPLGRTVNTGYAVFLEIISIEHNLFVVIHRAQELIGCLFIRSFNAYSLDEPFFDIKIVFHLFGVCWFDLCDILKRLVYGLPKSINGFIAELGLFIGLFIIVAGSDFEDCSACA